MNKYKKNSSKLLRAQLTACEEQTHFLLTRKYAELYYTADTTSILNTVILYFFTSQLKALAEFSLHTF